MQGTVINENACHLQVYGFVRSYELVQFEDGRLFKRISLTFVETFLNLCCWLSWMWGCMGHPIEILKAVSYRRKMSECQIVNACGDFQCEREGHLLHSFLRG